MLRCASCQSARRCRAVCSLPSLRPYVNTNDARAASTLPRRSHAFRGGFSVSRFRTLCVASSFGSLLRGPSGRSCVLLVHLVLHHRKDYRLSRAESKRFSMFSYAFLKFISRPFAPSPSLYGPVSCYGISPTAFSNASRTFSGVLSAAAASARPTASRTARGSTRNAATASSSRSTSVSVGQ